MKIYIDLLNDKVFLANTNIYREINFIFSINNFQHETFAGSVDTKSLSLSYVTLQISLLQEKQRINVFKFMPLGCFYVSISRKVFRGGI